MELIPTPPPLSRTAPRSGLQSGAEAVTLRLVGPGRLERGYQLQIARLSRDMEALQGVHHSLEAELDVARLVERGTARYVERVETRMQAEQAQTRRLLVLMGSLQRENERLASRVDTLQARLGRIEPARERHSLWKRIGAALFHAPAILPGRTA